MPIRRSIVLLCLGALTGASLKAGPPLLTGDALPAEKGVLEIYAGQRYQKSAAGVIGRETSSEFAFGGGRDWEVNAEIPYVVESDVSGWEDVTVGAKYRFLREAATRPAMALSAKAELPTANASKGLGYGTTIFSIRGRIQKSFGAWTTLGNLGYTFLGEPKINGVRKSRENPWFCSVAEEFKVTKKLSLAGEVYLQTRDKPGAANRFAYSVAFKRKLAEGLRLHGAIGSSLRNDNLGGPKIRVFLGFKYEWPVAR
jgi:hypothetical protein